MFSSSFLARAFLFSNILGCLADGEKHTSREWHVLCQFWERKKRGQAFMIGGY